MTPKTNKTCKGPNCQRKLHCKQLCNSHYAQFRKTNILTEILPGKRRKTERRTVNKTRLADGTVVRNKCSFETCLHKATTRTYCVSHYQQYMRGKGLKPLRIYVRNK